MVICSEGKVSQTQSASRSYSSVTSDLWVRCSAASWLWKVRDRKWQFSDRQL